MRIRYLFLFYLLLTFSSSYSQKIEENRPINLENFTTMDGLSQSTVFAIAQDRFGYMWFGTRKGLNKYDGYDFTIYKNDKSDPTSISHNFIRCLFVDSKGNLWVGTTGGGLNLYDYNERNFSRFTSDAENPNSLSQDDVFTIVEDTIGHIWIGTNYGISILDPTNKNFIAIDPKNPLFQLRDKSIRCLYFDDKNNLWIGTTNGLCRYDISKNELTCYQRDPEKDNVISGNIISSIISDTKGRLWIGTEDGGLNEFIYQKDEFKNFVFDPDDSHSIRNNVVRDIFEDSYGNYWIATDGGGINMLNPDTGKFFPVSGVSEYFSQLPRAIIKFYSDNKNNLWISSYGTGVFRFNYHKNNVHNFRHIVGANSLSHNSVLSIAEDTNKNILIGTDGGGLNLFKPENNYSFEVKMHEPGNKNSPSSNVIKSVEVDSKNQIWMGTFNAGLIHFNPAKNKYTTYYNDPGNSFSIPNNSIWDILKDHNGDMWFVTQIGGVCFMKSDQPGRFITYTDILNDTSSLSNFPLNIIYEDKTNTIWVGTESAGLYRFDAQKLGFTKFINDPNDSTTLSSNGVQAIFEDNERRFWIGTDGGGLNLFDRKTGKFQRRDDLVEAESIFDIVEDQNGDIWISTDNGIFSVSISNNTYIRYDVNDGVQGKEFNFNAATVSSEGILYFGGLNGFNMIDPNSINISHEQADLIFTNFLQDNRILLPNENGPLKENINNVSSIVIDYHKNNFGFVFSSLEFSKVKSTRYAYNFSGNDEWINLGTKNSVNFMNMSAGKYQLNIKCTNSVGEWNSKILSVELIVLPPWWSTWWFRSFALIFISGLIYFIYLLRIRNFKKQERKLKEIVVQRTKEIKTQKEFIESKNQQLISAQEIIDIKNKELLETNNNLEKLVEERTRELQTAYKKLYNTTKEYDQFVYRSAHDLKGPLARLKGLSYLAKREGELKNHSEYFDFVDEVSQEMETKLGRLMRIHKINEKEISRRDILIKKFIIDLVEECCKGQESNEINFIYDIPGNLKHPIDDFLFSILLKNLIDNAIQFKDPENPLPMIEIKVKMRKGKLEVTIKDNGLGINKTLSHQIFDMFVVANEKSHGFGLGLYESKMIVEKLEGKIKLVDSKKGNTQFLIRVG